MWVTGVFEPEHGCGGKKNNRKREEQKNLLVSSRAAECNVVGILLHIS